MYDITHTLYTTLLCRPCFFLKERERREREIIRLNPRRMRNKAFTATIMMHDVNKEEVI